MEIPFFHRLSYRQALQTVLVAFLLGVVLSGLQIAYDLVKEREQVDATVSQVLGMLRESAAQAVYNVDKSMTQTVANGLFAYRPFIEAQITDEFDIVLARKVRPAAAGPMKWLVMLFFSREKQYTVSLFYDNAKEPIGKVRVSIDTYIIAKNFMRRAGVLLVIGLIRNIVLSCVLTLLFYYTLTWPLLIMVRHVSGVDSERPGDTRVPSPKGHEKDEMGLLARAITRLLERLGENLELRRVAEKELEKHRDHLEQMVNERTSELRKALEEVEAANQEIMESLRYAKTIQRSLLADPNEVRTYLPDCFFIWIPCEIVSGDIFYTDCFGDNIIIAVIDCTGHGVPGAVMTMLAFSAIRRVTRNEECRDPAEILKRMNRIIKTTLQQDTEYALSDDGLDAAVARIQLSEAIGASERSPEELIFAGAKLSLTCVYDEAIRTIKGDRQSIGYKNSDLDFTFSKHSVKIEAGMSFYMASDGFTDQLGGKKGLRFGTRRFKNLLKENAELSFEAQQEKILQTFNEYRGDNERQDDVTVVGFGSRDLHH